MLKNAQKWRLYKLDRHITWENYFNNYILPNQSAILRILGKPRFDLYFDADIGCLGCRIWSDDKIDPSLQIFKTINIFNEEICNESVINLSVKDEDLFCDFFNLISNLSDKIQLMNLGINEAFSTSVGSMEVLLSRKQILSTEKQIGLWGELYVLDHLIERFGTNAISSWVGPTAEAHDFRLKKIELEVKTTTRENREHFIHGLTQLMPSPGSDLFFVSIQLSKGGSGGKTLCQLVEDIEKKLDSFSSKDFFNKLYMAGYRSGHKQFYLNRLKIRSDILVVLVDNFFPAFTQKELRKSVPKNMLSRLSNFSYCLDVLGLASENINNFFMEKEIS